MISVSRRRFLQTGISSGAALLAMQQFGMFTSLAAASSSYRALVCIFLFGGNDSNNVIIPLDDYATYAATRGSAASLNIAQDTLLPIVPPSAGGTFGLHPSLAPLHSVFNEGRLAIVCNVGPLVESLTRSQYLARNARVPLNLFSHSDQQQQWQTCVSTGPSATGWGGRTADRFAGSETFPSMISTAGLQTFVSASTVRPLTMTPGQTFALAGYTSGSTAAKARYAAVQELLALDREHTLIASANDTTSLAIQNSATLSSLPQLESAFPNTAIGNQLKQIAQLIQLNRDQIGLSQQIFFCSLGGFDTHNGQLTTQSTLLGQLGGAMAAFDAAMTSLKVSDAVTTFTLSDFSRTFQPNNTAGTDHAWGAHHFVMGGAVRGADFYGRFPTLVPDGPDDTDSGSGARGRWIPTTAVDQYAATLARWYGVPDVDLPAVLPNLGRFESATLGFLNT